MRKLLDLLNEVEEKQTKKPIKEEGPSVIDEVGKFYVVKKVVSTVNCLTINN